MMERYNGQVSICALPHRLAFVPLTRFTSRSTPSPSSFYTGIKASLSARMHSRNSNAAIANTAFQCTKSNARIQLQVVMMDACRYDFIFDSAL